MLPESPPVLTVREVAKALRVSVPTIYRWVKGGELEAIRHGKQWSRGQAGRGGAIRIPAAVVAAKLQAIHDLCGTHDLDEVA
ncbi:helix-turn-helix domain-containing protein [Kitasatospora sp. NBC_01302]|uniref:helix-turn-helix domain-containing protein n=1 Tax=Kitasatospora sp. NBC_01302 TaxID=2903575 RepID=UPI002E0D64BA